MDPAAALAVLLCAAPALAGDPGEAALRAEAGAIVDLFYGHDFDKAAPAADQLAARHKGHPAGPLFQAIVAYQRWTAEGLREDGSWEKIDGLLTHAAADAAAMEASAPAESHYYRGAALGFRARGMAARRKFVRALPDAASSVRQLRQALDLDPSLEDARLGLGMYHYFAARMPTAAKPLARLLVGERPDREAGLAELWTVAGSTGIARMEARAVLAMILSKEDEADWKGAEALLAELMGRYPRNPLYRLRRAFVAERRGDWDAAAALADPDGAWLREIHPGLRENSRAWALYRAGEARLLQGRRDEARRFLTPIDERKAPKSLLPWLKRRRAELATGARGREVAPYFAGY
ncbi:MAG: hypothetical protein HY079_13890 [Elusimicrobia bacterium]|nr:hypothetical protein [Elusimicrobiota bacterium]